MSDHTISPGFTISGVTFENIFNSDAARSRPVDFEKPDPFDWRLMVGRFAPNSGVQAFKTTCSFTPKGAPAGTGYGLKQIAFHKFLSMSYAGLEPEHGSQTIGTTSINFTWNLDCVGANVGNNFSAPSLPFFSALAKPVANNSQGSITITDSPGGTARLVRANMLTAKRNFLQKHASETNFITALVVERPDGAHVPVRAVQWTFSTSTTVVWTDGKPKLQSVGGCSFISLLDPDEIQDVRKRLLADNALMVSDTILHKVNQGLSTAEMLDAAAAPTPNSPDTVRKFDGGTYAIEHSRKALD
ncbi:hypothetical protein J2Y55_001637 [Bosea sp. BE125]|uniref:hypothetical protein n=1 Tax=Bosea sp. BE125 TaxID=2817909 RepID=UPI00285C2F59|nr:hypothetical protein [Bosea sp. BE125]MDR6870637.1 hypothetical protein [Bosea sp. BE125]